MCHVGRSWCANVCRSDPFSGEETGPHLHRPTAFNAGRFRNSRSGLIRRTALADMNLLRKMFFTEFCPPFVLRQQPYGEPFQVTPAEPSTTIWQLFLLPDERCHRSITRLCNSGAVFKFCFEYDSPNLEIDLDTRIRLGPR